MTAILLPWLKFVLCAALIGAAGPVLVQGAFAFALVAAIYVIALSREHAGGRGARTGVLFPGAGDSRLIFVNRSFSSSLVTALRRPNVALAWVLVVIPVALGAALLFPPISALFRFGPVHADDLALTLGAGILVLVFLEFLKSFWRGRLWSAARIPDPR
jgi:Ca2+-transporting ATPase